MSTEENKAIIHRFSEEVVNKGNLAAIADLVAPNLRDNNPLFGEEPGYGGIKQVFAMLHAAFPDFACNIEDLITEGDKVVERFTATGTHTGWFKGIAPTSKNVTMRGIAIFRIADDKIVERWGYVDTLGVLQQLGMVPAMGQAGS